MTFAQLLDFVTNPKRMTMAHIYQPVLIRALVDTGGTATIRQIAHTFLAHDECALGEYEKTIKTMPLRVLTKHGVVRHDGELVSLTVGKLTFEQQTQLRLACEQRLQDFLQKRGLSTWDYRMLADPVPGSLRNAVLAAGGGRCALCGATKKERPLDVDHIMPRSRHGKTERANLQAMCSKCNRVKGNRDTTDYRNDIPFDRDASCPFCSDTLKIEADNGTVFAIRDKHPVTAGRHLVVPRRHTLDYFTMTALERQHAEELLRVLRNRLAEQDRTIHGFNVGMNCGETAGQTVMHAHIHLIPRRQGDTPKPRGGVRGVVPARMDY